MKTILTVLVVAFVSFASADAMADKKEAEKLFRAGERYFDAGRYDMAADAFERAHESLPLPAIAFSAAQAHRLQYFRQKDDTRLKRAVELYRQYIEEQKEGGRIKDAVTNLAELEPLLAAAEAKGRVGGVERKVVTQLILTSPIEGAKGSIDGGDLAVLPHDVVVKAGRHKVRFEAKGYAPLERTVDVVEGQMRAVEGELKALPVRLSINATSGAEVRVDGRKVGTAPLTEPVQIEAGNHFVTATKRGHKPFAISFSAQRGERVAYDADLSTTRQRKISYVFLGTGGALMLGSLLSGIGALSLNATAKDLEDKRQREGLTPAELEEYRDAREDRDLAQQGALGLFIVAAAVGGTGALLYYLDNSDPERPPSQGVMKKDATTKLTPALSGEGAGLVLSGSF